MSGPSQADLARHWLALARGDLATAKVVVRDAALPPRAAAIVAAQAVEKALKAALVFAGIEPPLSHHVRRLAGLVDAELGLRITDVDLSALTDAQWARDPDYGDRPLTHEEAETLVGDATVVVDSVTIVLHERGLEPPPPA